MVVRVILLEALLVHVSVLVGHIAVAVLVFMVRVLVVVLAVGVLVGHVAVAVLVAVGVVVAVGVLGHGLLPSAVVASTVASAGRGRRSMRARSKPAGSALAKK